MNPSQDLCNRAVPNWERVVAGGLVTAFLLNPEMFIDASGQLTSYAVAAFAELGVEIAMSVPGGLAEGINRAVRRRFENGEGWTVLVVVAAIITVPIGWLLDSAPRRGVGAPTF
ncbi:hypothetical protein [Gemmobacter sp.]|uniref:hypothetical protein n=1 Tax=Gemmobacter sp. TaxID=1898957 RepID=UPI002AFECEB2|nr:hypothetical protein [Gemmobacter sp.]